MERERKNEIFFRNGSQLDLSCGKWENFAAGAPEWEKIRKKEGMEGKQSESKQKMSSQIQVICQ